MRAPFAAAVLLLAACDSYDLSDQKDLIAAGQRFVAQRGCPTCHQSSNPADGVLSGQSTPQPMTTSYGANLTPDVMTGIGGWADIQVERAIRYGVDDQQMQLCPTMPRFDGTDKMQAAMSDVEAGAIIAYLRSLPPVSHTVPESTCAHIKPPDPADLAVAAAPDDGGAPHD